MFRYRPAYRAVIEVSHSGSDEERELFAEVLALRNYLAREGITLREVRRGAAPGLVVITVGPGAELPALRVVDRLMQGRVGGAGGPAVQVRPFDAPRPYELPQQARQVKELLLRAESHGADAPELRGAVA